MAFKILMFGWEFPPHNSGGLGTACFGLTRSLARRDAKVIFVLPQKVSVSSDYAKILFANIDSVKFRRVDTLLYPYITSESYTDELSYLEDKDAVYGLSLMEEVKRYGFKARKIAKTEDFEIIHAHDWLSFPAGLEAKYASGKPLVVHVHATEFDRTGGGNINKEVYEMEKRGMEGADAVIAVSALTKNMIVKHYGIPEGKVTVVHNGIERDEFRRLPSELASLKAAGNKIVLFVGRITLQKGPDYFVSAARRVLEYRPKTLFVVSGTGDMERQMMRQAAEAGIGDKVLFAGFLRGDDLHRVYQAADLYVMPSVSEPFGITPLEALANGTPVLISKQSGVSEVLTHALKADFWDIDDMTDKIISVLDHSPLHETLRDNGGLEIGKLNWMASAAKCIDLYGRVLSGAK